jgi:hypothetical protein
MTEDGYESPAQTDLSFGDIFDSSFLYDAYLRGDVISLGRQQAHPRLGNGYIYSDLVKQKHDEDYLLSHGRLCEAIVLSESCAIDKNVGISRPARIHGRLTAAAVILATPDEIQSEGEKNRYSRFALPAANGYHGGIIDFERVFSLDMRDASNNKERRLARLSETTASQLEARWSAHAVRKGPWAAAIQASKALEKLSESGLTFTDEQAVVLAISELVAAVWQFEGNQLDLVDEHLKDGVEPAAVITNWVAGLERIKDSALGAVNAIRESSPSA